MMDKGKASSFLDRILSQPIPLSRAEAECHPMPIPDMAIMNRSLLDQYENYQDNFADGLSVVRFPVPDAIWQSHLEEIEKELGDADDPSYKKQLQQHKIPMMNSEGIPILPYAHATSILDNLLNGGINEDTSPRFEAIFETQKNIRDAVWQGHDTEPLIAQLASLLYQPDTTYNVTRDAAAARIVAEQIEDVAQHAKDKVLGLGVNRGK